MKSRITKTMALAALMAGAAGVAHATEGWYGRADIGYSTNVSADGNVGAANFSPHVGNDWMGDVGLGYAFQNGFRAEGELAYRTNDWKGDLFESSLNGRINAWSAMANLYYDFNRGGRVQPYVGVGAGAARVRGSVAGFGHDDDTVFAWQAMVGIAFALTDQWDLDVGYRYLRADSLDLAQAFFGDDTSVDYQHQAVTVGLRYQFAAPAPPPPPPPPPAPPPPPPPPPPVACPTSDFVVYFEWDRSNLNQAALETIDAAVNRARECNVSGVVVVGHTDTSGSAQYNIGLSNRRASVVRDALVARGISADTIQTNGVGETDLARPTRDGVREPLNRRTAVTISFR